MRRLVPSQRELPISRLQETISRNLTTSSENWALIGHEGARVVFLESQTHMTDRPEKHPISAREREAKERRGHRRRSIDETFQRKKNPTKPPKKRVICAGNYSDFQSYYATMQILF